MKRILRIFLLALEYRTLKHSYERTYRTASMGDGDTLPFTQKTEFYPIFCRDALAPFGTHISDQLYLRYCF